MKQAVKVAALAAFATLGLSTQGQAVTLNHSGNVAGSNEVGSVDYFQFSTVGSSNVTIETFSNNFDSVLWLFNDDGALTADDYVAFDDDSGTRGGSSLGFYNS